MRPGPRVRLEEGLISLLRDTLRERRVVEFDYRARSTGRTSRQRVDPYGVLYANRAFLVGRTDWNKEPRLWRLDGVSVARVLDESFEQNPEFDLRSYAARSFGTFQETPVDVALRFDEDAARDAANFLFHPSQSSTRNDDGTFTVRFRAGGIDEMCWHLVTWGGSVTVEDPPRLRQRLVEMCEALAARHRTAD